MRLLEEVALRVRRVHTPPVVREHIEHAKYKNEESRRPLGLEANRHHSTGAQSNDRDEYASKSPFTLEYETQEKEDKKHTTCKKETRCHGLKNVRWGVKRQAHYFLRSVSLMLGSPANRAFLDTIESLKTMKSPPMTLRLRRKKLRSKMRPYPKP